MSHTRRVVSREPDIAVFASDILRQRTVDVWPRSVCRQVLDTKLAFPALGEPKDGHLPRHEIPHPDITITATANQSIVPRNHSPDAHDVAL